MTQRRFGRVRSLLLVVAWAWLLVSCFIDLESPGDYSGFVAFGRAANEGSLAYDPSIQARLASDGMGSHWATWPPGFVPISSSLARLDAVAHAPTVILFQLSNLALLALALLVTARWLSGPGVLVRGGDGGSDGSGSIFAFLSGAPLLAAGLLVPFRLVLSNFEHAQINLIVLGLVITGVYLLDRRPWWGGLLFGVGSAVKATPILLLPYLAWRRRWRALGYASTGVFIAWFALPALWLGPDRMFVWWKAWIDALPASGRQVGWMNQSLQSIAVLQFGPTAGLALWLAGTVALAVAILVALGAPFRGVDGRRTAMEVAVLLAAITIVSPVSWKAHYVTLVPLCAGIFEFGRTAPVRPVRGLTLWVLGIAAVGFNASSPELIGWGVRESLQSHGLILSLAGLLTATALWLLARRRPDRALDSTP